MDTFYASLPALTAFEGIVDRAAYRALPEDWLIGLTDVVASTDAVANGRYKAVNLAGAAVVSALANAGGTLDFPYVFTGDGMVCAVPSADADLLRQTLAIAMSWVGDALGLSLRGAIVSVRDIRAAGHDIRIARFTPTATMAYAMFSGGGLTWAEAALKAGKLPQVEAQRGRPNLSGLSCRFKPIASRNGVILSMIVAPTRPMPDEAFRTLVDDLLRLTVTGHPVPPGGPRWGWPPAGLALEARLQQRSPGRPRLSNLVTLGIRTLVAAAVVNLGFRVGGFVPARYKAQIVENTDFRKFGDGLMMTVDCSFELADAIETRLAQAEAEDAAEFGTHRQDAALMTCVVPSPNRPGHIHFIDGAGGGYTLASRRLKERRAATKPPTGLPGDAAVTPAGAEP